MAQNVTIAGASYSDVPSITVPKTGGGTASFVDTTIASGAAAAADILSGKYAWVNGVLLEGTGSGGGGGGLVYETGTYTPASDTAQPTISFTNTHTERPIFICLYDIGTTVVTGNSNLYWGYFSAYDAFGTGAKTSSSAYYYGRADWGYKTSNGSSSSGANLSTITGTATTAISYWATNTGFSPSVR